MDAGEWPATQGVSGFTVGCPIRGRPGSRIGSKPQRRGALCLLWFHFPLSLASGFLRSISVEGDSLSRPECARHAVRAKDGTGWTVTVPTSSSARTPSCAASRRSTPAKERTLVDDFVAAWSKVMNLDRFDLD